MKKNTSTTWISFILDKSGSMASIQNDTIGGFNTYLKTLQKKGNTLFSLTMFDTTIQRVCTNLDVKKVTKLNTETYQPGGMTALYDAVVSTIEDLHKEVKTMDKKPTILIVVMTDGEENSSTKHDQKCFRDFVKKTEREGNWTFVFLGANQDSWANASQVGLTRGNVADWTADAQGTQAAFRSLSANSVAFMASADSGIKSVNNFMSLAEDNLKKNLKGGVK